MARRAHWCGLPMVMLSSASTWPTLPRQFRPQRCRRHPTLSLPDEAGGSTATTIRASGGGFSSKHCFDPVPRPECSRALLHQFPVQFLAVQGVFPHSGAQSCCMKPSARLPGIFRCCAYAYAETVLSVKSALRSGTARRGRRHHLTRIVINRRQIQHVPRLLRVFHLASSSHQAASNWGRAGCRGLPRAKRGHRTIIPDETAAGRLVAGRTSRETERMPDGPSTTSPHGHR